MHVEDRFDIKDGTVIVNKLIVVVSSQGLRLSQGVCERVTLGLMIDYLDEKVLCKVFDEIWVL